MSDWIDVIQQRAFAPDEHMVIDVDGTDVAVFNIDGEAFALEDICTHDGAEIASGIIEAGELICPRHGARFCVKTGKALSPPAYVDLYCFPVRIHNGIIQVRDDRWD